MGIRFITTGSHFVSLGSTNTLLNDQEPFTIAFWANRFAAGAGNFGSPICKNIGTGSGAWTINDNGGSFVFNKDYSTTNLNHQFNGLFTAGWNHYCLTWDGSVAGVSVYKNGVIQTVNIQTDGSGTKESDSRQPMMIGNRLNAQRTWNATMADIAFWGSAILNLDQIRLLASSRMNNTPLQITTPTGGLRFYIPGDERSDVATYLATSNSIMDRGPNRIHGTPGTAGGGALLTADNRVPISYA